MKEEWFVFKFYETYNCRYIKRKRDDSEALYQSALDNRASQKNNTKTPQKLAKPSTPFAPPGYYCWKCWFERNSENRVNRMCKLSITDLLLANL